MPSGTSTASSSTNVWDFNPSGSGGSQPRTTTVWTPPWWPKDGQGKNVGKLYRVMRSDLKDLFPDRYREKCVCTNAVEDPRLPRCVVDAVNTGSRTTSPFLHATTSFKSMWQWLQLGKHRNDAEWPPCVEIDIWGWFQSGDMPENAIIDLSTRKAQMKFFGADYEKHGIDQSELMELMGHADRAREVLIKWRGEVPQKFMTLVDSTNGMPLGPYMELVADVMRSHETPSSSAMPLK